MNDKYKLLKENPQNCQRLFGMKYDIFEDILKKVQNNIQQKLTENPLSKRGIDSKFSIENQLLLTALLHESPLKVAKSRKHC